MVETKWCWQWNICERFKVTNLYHKSIVSGLFRQGRSRDVSGNFYLKIELGVFVEYFCQIHIFYVNIAGKALYVWFRRRKDNEHLTSLALNQKVSTARTKNEDCQFTDRTGKHLSLWLMPVQVKICLTCSCGLKDLGAVIWYKFERISIGIIFVLPICYIARASLGKAVKSLAWLGTQFIHHATAKLNQIQCIVLKRKQSFGNSTGFLLQGGRETTQNDFCPP